MKAQLFHNRIGRINLTPLDTDQCATTALQLRSAHSTNVFQGNITVLEYGSKNGSLLQYSYAFGPAVQLRKEHETAGLMMMLVLEGRLVLQAGVNEDCTVAEAIACLFRSREYSISFDEQCTVRYLLFNIEPLAERLQLQGFEEGRYQLTEIMQAQLFEVLHPPKVLASPEDWLSGQLIGMLYQLKESIDRGLKLHTKIYDQDFALAADVFIRRNLSKDFTTKEISRQVGINECNLKKAYSLYYGTGMGKRQNRLRIERAKLLLQQTDKAISEVAAECGYNNTKSLYNNFFRETTLRPAEWRKKYSI